MIKIQLQPGSLRAHILDSEDIVIALAGVSVYEGVSPLVSFNRLLGMLKPLTWPKVQQRHRVKFLLTSRLRLTCQA